MTDEFQNLIDAFCDDTLTAEQGERLNELVKRDVASARQFALAMILHDRLRAESLVDQALNETSQEVDLDTNTAIDIDACQMPARAAGELSRNTSWHRRFTVMAIVTSVALCLLAINVWQGGFESTASAAVGELNRIIQANRSLMDRTYQIKVEEATSPTHAPSTRPRPEDARPPKPPMDDAVLHVRGGGQFVLVRQTAGGLPFVTGCNGKSSWAVRPTGPVRFSADLDRFNHDVPGHEHAMPLINIQEGLERLRAAYDVQLLPIETDENMAERRLLVAVKKPKERGPRRVEITYAVSSGLIQQMRFVDMPYGPDRLTLRMTLADDRELGASFFDHASHHEFDREVVEE